MSVRSRSRRTDSGNPASGIAGVYFVEYQWDLTLGIWKRIQIVADLAVLSAAADARLMPQPQPFTGSLAAVPGMRYLQTWGRRSRGQHLGVTTAGLYQLCA